MAPTHLFFYHFDCFYNDFCIMKDPKQHLAQNLSFCSAVTENN